MKSIAVLLVVLLTHYGYEWAAYLGDATAKESSWFFYSFRGVEGVVLCWLLLPVFQKQKDWLGTLGVFALMLGMMEEAQTAVCGIAGVGIEVPLWSGLCLERFGPLPYMMFTALAITLLVRGIKRDET